MKILLDVVVVGAGCVGSYLATLLSDVGLEVLVIDKDIDVRYRGKDYLLTISKI